MSCADPKKDSKEIIKEKVNCMWEKYFSEFGCEGQSFTPEKNVLKYSINQNFNYFVDGVVKEFNLNINLKDPADGKTLLDYALEEKIRLIASYARRPATTISEYEKDKLKELEDFCIHLKNDLNAKHSNELTPQDALPYRVKKTQITVLADILKKYEGKYVTKGYNPIYIKLESEKLLYSFGENAKYFELSADSKTTFFRKPTPAFANSEFTFKMDSATGKYDLIVYQNSKNILLKSAE